MRAIILIYIFVLFTYCSRDDSESQKEIPSEKNKIESDTLVQSPTFKVHHHGALKQIMHQGNISAQASLSDFKELRHLYALGALENLKGEILILNSQPFISNYEGQKMKIDTSMDFNATLFVYADVENWQSYEIPVGITSYEELEKFIENTAREKGLNLEEPFPFLVEGEARKVDWHVINWPEEDTEHTHEKHVTSGEHGTLENKPVEVLGFFSTHHHAIFTHHTTNMHLHFITENGDLAGHADNLIPGDQMHLKLPN
ncbi:MAG: acetolactate decarboxylase [Crocinitomicaceae bacterium]